MKSVVINKSGRITLPVDLRRRQGWKAGDRILVSENAKGEIVLTRMRTVEELTGVFKLRPGVKADPDFGNIIHDVMEEAAERLVAETRDEHDAERRQGEGDGLLG